MNVDKSLCVRRVGAETKTDNGMFHCFSNLFKLLSGSIFFLQALLWEYGDSLMSAKHILSEATASGLWTCTSGSLASELGESSSGIKIIVSLCSTSFCRCHTCRNCNVLSHIHAGLRFLVRLLQTAMSGYIKRFATGLSHVDRSYMNTSENAD